MPAVITQGLKKKKKKKKKKKTNFDSGILGGKIGRMKGTFGGFTFIKLKI